MLNVTILQGRMTKDIVMRQTNSGKNVGNFSIAVDRDFKSQNGEKETDFIDVVVWDNTATFVQNYLGKGRMVIVKGRLQQREWTDKDGGKRTSYEVVADNVYFGDSKGTSENAPTAAYTPVNAAPATQYPGASGQPPVGSYAPPQAPRQYPNQPMNGQQQFPNYGQHY